MIHTRPPQPAPPPSTEPVATGPRRGRVGPGVVAAGAVVAAVAGGCSGLAALAYGFFAVFSDRHYGQLLLLSGMVAVAVGGQVASGWWAITARPGVLRIAVTQAPYVLFWAVLVPWWYTSRWHLGYAAWATAAVAVSGWWLVWYLRDPRNPRRAAVYLVGVALIFAGNGAGAGRAVWQSTDGLGLTGQPSPWHAWQMARATSCTEGSDYYVTRTGATATADCPSGPDGEYFASVYDKTGFHRAAEPAALEPFARWLAIAEHHHYSFHLEFDNAQPVEHGDTAELDTRVTVANFGPWRTPDVIRLSRFTEVWHVELHRVAFGDGWKVARITVADPIQVQPT